MGIGPVMLERWRLFKDRAPGWQASLYAGWSAFTIGVDIERHQWESVVTVHLGFVRLVVEWWRS